MGNKNFLEQLTFSFLNDRGGSQDAAPQIPVNRIPRKPRIKYEGKHIEFDYVANSVGVYSANSGIFIDHSEHQKRIATFNRVRYAYNYSSSDGQNPIIRVIFINKHKFHLKPAEITSRNAFNKMLLKKTDLMFLGNDQDFKLFIQVLLNMNNNLNVTELTGLGKTHPSIANLGNIIMRGTQNHTFTKIISCKGQSFALKRTNDIDIDLTGFEIPEIWQRLESIYGTYTFDLVGYAIATAFCTDITEKTNRFPILKPYGAAGSGKSNLGEILSAMFGSVRGHFTVNCDSLSTPIGIEEKTQELHNLPLILNEVSQKQDSYLKSRYDFDGSIKSGKSKNKRIHERKVTSSTIAISVNKPLDRQVQSRCILIDIAKLPRNKHEFDKLYMERSKLSTFIMLVYKNLTPDKIINSILSFRDNHNDLHIESRILDNYSILAGSMLALVKAVKSDILPTKKDIEEHFVSAMLNANAELNPLYHFWVKLNEIIPQQEEHNFILVEDKLIFLYLEGLWKYLTPDFKEKYYRAKGPNDIKSLLLNSGFVARAGYDLSATKSTEHGNLAISHNKKINGAPKRCVVLKLDSI